ncbi:cold shock domain-containing protein [Marinobacter confluentis]|uniref:Cold-shock protein n=1 Tax=Marinobacter confluentis TaxID=1697557 RepID=A0A4Z1C4W2_9GAMM|nr:cold shock domain-containing protein [Marinobacter confluentis]TGN41431.1 cold-shock protein [Marinobacter confluentis]
MPQGKVKWFNNAKGYGFIIEDGCTDDLFAHFSSVQMEGYKTLKAGQPVTFEKKPSDKGVHAVNIVPQDMPQRHDNAAGAETSSGSEPASDSASGPKDESGPAAFEAHQRAVNG